jgi:hypothetical protein
MKWVYFENLSTTVSMTLLPCTLGNASTKSMYMSDQTQEGTGKDCRRPAGVEPQSCSASKWHRSRRNRGRGTVHAR